MLILNGSISKRSAHSVMYSNWLSPLFGQLRTAENRILRTLRCLMANANGCRESTWNRLMNSDKLSIYIFISVMASLGCLCQFANVE